MTLTVSNITQETAQLTLSNYPGNWHYKADTGPDNTCKGPVAGSRKALAGLSNAETYTYSAYSDSACRTLLVTADAFTTRNIAVTNVAQTTATVTLNGYAGNWYYQADTGPDATACNGPTSGATAVNLASLTAGTPYTYRAYDNNTCLTSVSGGTANELAYASFTTIETTLTASNVTAAGATLTIANHSGNWYYQHSGAGATCQGPVAGNSQSLTTLTAGTYTYSAYSNSGCTTLLATAEAFTLGQHHVSSLTSAKTDGAVINKAVKEALAFTTGGSANGYTLTSVTLPLRVPTTATVGSLVITLHEMEGSAAYGTGSAPSATVLATLSGTAPTGAKWAETTYTCSGNGCSLSANTTYFVVAEVRIGEYAWAYTETNPHPEPTYPSNSGWDIGYSHTKESSRSWYSFQDWHLARVDFTTNPTLTVSNVGVTTATLAVANHSGAWYYKSTTAGKTTCTMVAAGTSSVDVAGLTANTAYTFSAYSDSACTTANLLAAASQFTTLFSVSNLTNDVAGDSDISRTSAKTIAFTTGANSGGYVLKSITVKLKQKGSPAGNLGAKLYAMQGSGPYNKDSEPSSTVLATLSGTPPTSASWTNTDYTCSGSGCELSGANSTYFIVFDNDDGDANSANVWSWAYTLSGSETEAPPNNGWDLQYGHSRVSGSWRSFEDWHVAQLAFATK